MISFLTYNSFILGSWNELYPGNEIPPNISGYNQVDQYKTTIEGNFYVLQVTFTTIKETEGDGGAIFIDAETKLLIESSNFINCHANGNGGAIYFYDTTGISFLKKVCSINSYSSTKFNHFCLIATKSSDQCTNGMEQSSVVNLKSTTQNYNNVRFIESGIIVLKNDNISKNECLRYPALVCHPSTSTSISYTSFENNTSTELEVIYFSSEKVHDMNTCNFIRNTANFNSPVLGITGSLNISNSCLTENSDPMFYFYSVSSCTIINCTIDNTNKIGDGSVTVDSNSRPPEPFINNLDNNYCFTMNMSITYVVCPTFNMRQYKRQMDEKRGVFILAIF